MTRPDNCPHCGVSLIGGEIPENIRQHYSPPYRWRREILVEVLGSYDGGLYYECPDCHGAWNRFPVGHWLYYKAEEAIKEHYLHEDHRVHHVSSTTPSVKHRTDDWGKVTCISCLRSRPDE